MKKMISRLTIILSFLWSLILATICYASPLVVEISLNKNPSRNEFVKDPSSFVVATKITNVSDSDQTISVWLCSYGWSWVASSSAIVTGLEGCSKNYPMDIVLKPKESYSRDLVVMLSSKAKAEPLTFQMGFNLKNDWEGARLGIASDKQQLLTDIIWSNPITIEVTNPMVDFLRPDSEELILKSNDEFQMHGVKVQCEKNDDCWCRNFQGSFFVEGKKPNTCDHEMHVCLECVYE